MFIFIYTIYYILYIIYDIVRTTWNTQDGKKNEEIKKMKN